MKQSKGTESALLDHAKSRTTHVVTKIRDALAAIELDIEHNDGIYPFNGGTLNKAEVCRRAGVHKVTLYGAAHRETTTVRIEAWLKKIKQQMVTGKRAVRKAVTARADDWHDRYLKAAQMTNVYHLEFASLNERLAGREARVAELELLVAQLQAELSEGKVVRISTKRK